MKEALLPLQERLGACLAEEGLDLPPGLLHHLGKGKGRHHRTFLFTPVHSVLISTGMSLLGGHGGHGGHGRGGGRLEGDLERFCFEESQRSVVRECAEAVREEHQAGRRDRWAQMRAAMEECRAE